MYSVKEILWKGGILIWRNLAKMKNLKILVSKVQHILEWTKTKIYLDTNSEQSKK